MADDNSQLPASTDDIPQHVIDRVMNNVAITSASGGYTNQFQVFMKKMDRYQHTILPPNSEHSGLTFITRPKLCLTDQTIRQGRRFAPLITKNPLSMAYAIRCLLDTKFMKDNMPIAKHCPFLDVENPFFVPLCNGLTSLSGLPDPFVQTYTTEGGFHSEDQTFVIGGDDLNKSYDLSLSFKDIQYGPIASIFMHWLEYMRMVTKGTAMAYIEDIDAQRINYTVSIYRFVLDPTRTYITRWARAVGCFPKSIPYGDMLSVNEGETFVASVGKFSVPFQANKIIYDDYAVFEDFNRLVRRYCPGIENRKPLTSNAINNYSGIPYIRYTPKGNIIEFRVVPAPAPEVPVTKTSMFQMTRENSLVG